MDSLKVLSFGNEFKNFLSGKGLTLHYISPTFNNPEGKGCGKERNPFPTMFSPLLKRNFTISAPIKLSSANYFNLGMSEFSLPGKELNKGMCNEGLYDLTCYLQIEQHEKKEKRTVSFFSKKLEIILRIWYQLNVVMLPNKPYKLVQVIKKSNHVLEIVLLRW